MALNAWLRGWWRLAPGRHEPVRHPGGVAGYVGGWVLKGMLLLAHTVPNTATQA
jgi:hypothetical protein